MFAQALQQQESTLRALVQGALAQVAQDYNLSHQELVQRYLPPTGIATIKDGDTLPGPLLVPIQEEKQKKRQARPRPDKICCQGITAQGKPCKFAAGPDGFCKKHAPGDKPATTKKPTKTPKPRHTHLVEESTPEDGCPVCETQGDATQPQTSRQDWEIQGADEIQQRLKKMLEEVKEQEAEDEDEDEPPTESTELEVSPEELFGEDQELEDRLKKILAEDSDEEEDDE